MTEQQPRPTASTGPSSGSAAPAFVAELTDRVDRTRASIDAASDAGEDTLVDAHLAELESLLHLAEQHDVALPDTRAWFAQRSAGAGHVVLDLTAQPSAHPAPA